MLLFQRFTAPYASVPIDAKLGQRTCSAPPWGRTIHPHPFKLRSVHGLALVNEVWAQTSLLSHGSKKQRMVCHDSFSSDTRPAVSLVKAALSAWASKGEWWREYSQQPRWTFYPEWKISLSCCKPLRFGESLLLYQKVQMLSPPHPHTIIFETLHDKNYNYYHRQSI